MHGVSLSAVFSQDGIFSRAEQATEKYGKAKARETLEMAFSNLQAEKYETRLSAEALDTRITEEINKMGGEEIGDDKTEVIVDGYRFTVDRTVPKIVEELGKADGVVISASVSGNKVWFKQGETINVTVTGIIKTYSGGNITTVSATKGGEAISGFSIDGEGRYTISDITSNTTIEIKAKDSKNKENEKSLPITIKVDGTAPTVETVNAEANGMDIIISATGHDKNGDKEESGINKFHYTITPTDGVTPTSGDFEINEKTKITTTVETTYTINVTATDKVGNGPSTQKSTTVKVEIPFGEKETVKKTAGDGEWWIPKGFAEASDSSSTIQGGKVIEDKTGNQWVWIPCYLGEKETSKGYEQYSKATEYKRTDFGKQDGSYSQYSETLDGTDEASIKKYGGFYIGRYEAGRVGTDTVVLKRNQTPYNNITIANCKTKSTNFASDNKYDTSKVYTKLVSSYGWDTALSFIAVTNSSYPTNSTQGNYSSSLKDTGSSTAVCNIYDMGGNLWEYTSESRSDVSSPFVIRGGDYGVSASDYPAGNRYSSYGTASVFIGFRPLLYIK